MMCAGVCEGSRRTRAASAEMKLLDTRLQGAGGLFRARPEKEIAMLRKSLLGLALTALVAVAGCHCKSTANYRAGCCPPPPCCNPCAAPAPPVAVAAPPVVQPVAPACPR